MRGLGFSRNFGKEGAIFAGLKNAAGDCAVCIDCDLQHPPELIPEMYRLWQGGAEVVEAVKRSRGGERDCSTSCLPGGLLQDDEKLLGESTWTEPGEFKLMDRKVINALNELPERITFFQGAFELGRLHCGARGIRRSAPRRRRKASSAHEEPVQIRAQQHHFVHKTCLSTSLPGSA